MKGWRKGGLTWCRLAVAALAVLVAASGCSDGGVGGTGIESVVQGNVRDLITTDAASAGGGGARPCVGFTCIRVKVRDHEEISDDADEAGNFELRGVFPQVTVLEFLRRGRLIGSLTVLVPAASIVTLRDVEVGDDHVEPPDEIVTFLDHVRVVADPVCGEDPIELDVADGDGSPFTILVPASILPVDVCANRLCEGSEVSLKARQMENGTRLEAFEISDIDGGLNCLP